MARIKNENAMSAENAREPVLKDRVKDYFDDNAGEWQEMYREQRRVVDVDMVERKRHMMELVCMHLPAGSRILDVGCGAGHASLDLVQRGYVVHGLDIAQKMIDHANRNRDAADVSESQCAFICSDVSGASFEPGSFDGVIALGFLQYQADEVEELKIIGKLLRPDGLLVVTGPTLHRLTNFFGVLPRLKSAVQKLKRTLTGAQPPRQDVLVGISRNIYSVGRLNKLFRESGFSPTGFRGHGYQNFSLINRVLGYRGELFLYRVFTAIARVVPIQRWANGLIVVGRKNG